MLEGNNKHIRINIFLNLLDNFVELLSLIKNGNLLECILSPLFQV